ncbi:MAG: hypothetical protein ABS95_02565 [Verrucomicrobia bacterium SCN 57-15]|nr:MAG: hypothetical protein ABS95_02565 [Verrucomicrobia bacterium SCN 57-15]
MKRILLILMVLAALAAGLIFAFVEMRKEVAMEMQGEAPVVPESRLRRNAAGEVVVSLDAETQKRIALATAPVVATNFSAELRGYARVLDPSPLAALMADLASAEAALSASTNELKRARTLFAQDQNVSGRTLEQADVAARHDQIALATLRTKLMVAFGKPLAERTDLPTLVLNLGALDAALVRVELPVGAELKAVATGARLFSLGDLSNSIQAQLIGAVPSVEPQTQGQAFLFLANAGAGRLVPGQSLVALIPVSGEPRPGVLVPVGAVLRAEGRLWVYVQSGETNFVRRSVAPDQPVNGAWFVTNGVSGGERVVVTGAQTLLSEEFKGNIPVLAD